VRDEAALLELLSYIGADDAAIADAKNDIQRWARGSVWIELACDRKNLLRIRTPPFLTLREREKGEHLR
jgi:hypothetical protein